MCQQDEKNAHSAKEKESNDLKQRLIASRLNQIIQRKDVEIKAKPSNMEIDGFTAVRVILNLKKRHVRRGQQLMNPLILSWNVKELE